ncbi:MAG: hypothetical protein ACU84J_12485, partial [Gammaproteobacteria bacterium]
NRDDEHTSSIGYGIDSMPIDLDQYKKEIYLSGMEELSTCLKAWDIVWKFPYYPILTGTCSDRPTPSQDDSLFYNGKPRQTLIKLRTHANPLIPAEDYRTDKNRTQSAFSTHFDTLLANQGFIRISENDAFRSVFEKRSGDKTLRMSYGNAFQSIELVLEQLPGLKPKVKLPAPALPTKSSESLLDLFENGIYGAWFSLPYATVTEEKVGRGSPIDLPMPDFEQPVFSTPYWHASLHKKYTNMPFVKHIVFEYPAETSVLELNSVYRTVLKDAGWTIDTFDSRSLTASIELQHRQFIAVFGFRNDSGKNKVAVELTEPEFNELTEIIAYSLSRFYDYVFTPTLSASGDMTDSTRFQVNALNSVLTGTKESPRQGIALNPTVSTVYRNDAEILTLAQTDSQMLVHSFKQLGWQDRQIVLLTEPVIQRQDSGEFLHGVQVTEFFCRTLPKTGAPDKAETCICRNHFKTFEASPGACQ